LAFAFVLARGLAPTAAVKRHDLCAGVDFSDTLSADVGRGALFLLASGRCFWFLPMFEIVWTQSMTRAPSIKRIEEADAAEALELAFDDLDGLLGFRLRQASVAMYRDFIATLMPVDVTQKQTAALWLIKANPGVSQASLAATLDMDRATMMGLIDRLEDRGFVIRKRSTSDRRRQRLYLTPAGQNALNKIKTLIAKHERRFTSRFAPAELSALLAALQKISGSA
jgi:DNA-binding MarR family transcriptional regulator